VIVEIIESALLSPRHHNADVRSKEVDPRPLVPDAPVDRLRGAEAGEEAEAPGSRRLGPVLCARAPLPADGVRCPV